MARKISLVSLLLVVWNLNVSVGYKWENVKEGTELPSNIISLTDGTPPYVGRIFISNLIIPAEVYNSSYAVAFNPNTKTKFSRKKFQVLTASENCHWQYFGDFPDVPENVVRVGRAWNKEPIYLGRTASYKIGSILMTSKKFVAEQFSFKTDALSCDDNKIWIETEYLETPKNAIEINKNQFVARLYGPTHFIPASLSKISYDCSTNYNNIKINALSCEVLVGNSSLNEYSWKSPGQFEKIPQYAVVVGRTENDEFMFALRDHFKSFASATFSELVSVEYNYEILVKNAV
ncbi:uncharacterized protein LOC129908653 [Episyrphus balteatus]|uniref:uncharacterized protein LOC129908653 n=1 Tax=Episyrphus balteatus TaxID=286459 RepID=UPI002486B4FF|nr:uncharacterized protein LOC129908653 [Episyrphus balteatus]